MSLAGPVDRRKQLRRIPALTRGALRLVWRASPRDAVTMAVFQLGAAGAIVLQLYAAKLLLEGLVRVSGEGAPVSSLLPEFGLLVSTLVIAGGLAALVLHKQRLIGELVNKLTFDEIIGVSTAITMDAFETPAFHDKLQRARASGMYRPMEMVNSVSMLTTSTLTSVGIAFALLLIEPILLPLVVAAAIPLLLATLRNSKEAYAFEYALTPQSRERTYLMEVLTRRETAMEVRAFDSGPLLRQRYDALTEERLSRLRVFLRRRLVVSMAGTIATSFGTAIALGSLVWLLATGRLPVASALTAGLALQLLAQRLTGITGSLGRLVETGMFLDDFETFMQLAGEQLDSADEPEDEEDELRPAVTPFRGLEVQNLSFWYPECETPALEDVSLEINPGEVVALVGENGSGKTTLIKLICQLHAAQEGRIMWSGVDTRTVPARRLRSDMTVIFQDFIKYHLPAIDNIALGRVEQTPTTTTIEAAAKRAGAHEFLSGLPQGYDTRLGRQFYGGLELSIGQWQRLALARAFYRGGSFLVLDEPTAALDPRAERELFVQMRRLAAGRSVLLVSHRFSSVRTADRIYVMQEGRVAESGSHEELVEAAGYYAELFKLQEAAYLGNGASTLMRDMDPDSGVVA